MPTDATHPQALDRYFVQVKDASYDAVEALIGRAAHPTTQRLPGPRGVGTWRVKAGQELRPLSDHLIQIAGTPVAAELFHLPTHAYRALVASAPDFQQYTGLPTLYALWRDRTGAWDAGAVLEALRMTVQAGRVAGLAPQLVVQPKTFHATWCPDETYLRRIEGQHWMLVLSFLAHHTPIPMGLERQPIGLDLGLSPLAVMVTPRGAPRTFTLTALDRVDTIAANLLSSEEVDLLAVMTYASGRQDTEAIIAHLVHAGSVVYAEKLRLKGMENSFIGKARFHAVHDYHFSALSQMLYTAGVRFQRVPSKHTSVICAACFEATGTEVLGRRDGAAFTCPVCRKTVGSHANAAKNVLLRGMRRADGW